MEDFEWIEVGLLFRSDPPEEAIESLLESSPLRGFDDLDSGQCSISYSDEDYNSTRFNGSPSEASNMLANKESGRVKFRHDGFHVSIKKNLRRWMMSSMPHLIFREQVHPFTDPESEEYVEEVTQRRRSFVQMLADAAEILDPIWGFGRRGGLAIGEDQPVEGLANAIRPPLYEYNVFREETVKAIGRERVLDAPAWFVEELDTGGVFLAVREPPSSCSTHSEDYVEIADYLGLPVCDPTRYH